MFANNAQHAGTANILNTAEPTIAPTPKSPSVTKVPITLMNNSGLEVAAAITVAPATSSVTLRSVERFRSFYLNSFVFVRKLERKRETQPNAKNYNINIKYNGIRENMVKSGQ